MSEAIERKFSLFYPNTTGDIFKDYPHLRKEESFERLNRSEMMFVWYFACKSSPFVRTEDEQHRAKKSAHVAFGQKGIPEAVAKLTSLDFPEKIRAAIDRMSEYEPGPRIRAKMMIEKALTNFEALIDIDVTDDENFKNKDGEVDMGKKNSYTTLTINITKALPVLIQQAERGFDVTEIGETINEALDGSVLEEYLKDQKED